MDTIRPGNKVRILELVAGIVDDHTHILVVDATEDSIGTILTYEQYCSHVDNLHEKVLEKRSLLQDPHFSHLAWVKSAMAGGTHYPVRFDEFAPLPEDDYAKLKQEYSIVEILCFVEAITILPVRSFVLI